MNFRLGNIIKYLDRCEYKENKEEDLKKAQWYANEFIKVLGYKDGSLIEDLIAGNFEGALSTWKKTREDVVGLNEMLDTLSLLSVLEGGLNGL